MSISIITEISINPIGGFSIAKDLIKVAKQAVFDAIKFQKRTIDAVHHVDDINKPRESPWRTTISEQKEGLEFSQVQYQEIVSYCNELGIGWFASEWNAQSRQFLKGLI